MEIVELAGILNESAVFFRERCRAGGVEFQLEGAADAESVLISCIPLQVSQVFVNLLNNAWDAASAGREGWIRVNWSATAERVRLQVANSGPPIPDEVCERIMEPFFTTKPKGKERASGLVSARRSRRSTKVVCGSTAPNPRPPSC